MAEYPIASALLGLPKLQAVSYRITSADRSEVDGFVKTVSWAELR